MVLVMLITLSLAPVPMTADQPWTEPVAGTVIDGYRPPAHIGAPGNRGWEYRTRPGSAVVAAGAGKVAFAGAIGAHRYVSIDHPGGMRTTYSMVETITVARGQYVERGRIIATSGPTLHFGVRRGATYLDPARLFGRGASSTPARRSHLVPVTLR